MPVMQLDIQTRINALNSAVEPEHQEVITRTLQAAKGNWAVASAALKDKLPAESVERLHIADSLVTAVGNRPEIAKTILGQPGIKTIRDVARLNVEKLATLIAPNAAVDSDEYKQAKNAATAINNESFAREPLTVLHRMTADAELPLPNDEVRAGLSSFLSRVPPETDIRTTPFRKVLNDEALKDVAPPQQAQVIHHAQALWRTLAITPPDAPHVPPILMKANRTSAFLIGEMPESAFIKAYGGQMGTQTAKRVYANAISTRIRNEHALITMREAIRGTGLAAIDGTKTRKDRLTDAKSLAPANDGQLTLDSLFGDMDQCECKECQSVYSASAYFVELLNFLRNNNLDPDNPQTDQKGIAGTPLEKLFQRRPDLGDLELTCENTNTVLPYIDLVNEVMESYVVHRADYAASNPTLDVFNVSNETTEELLAQPQHTNYLAYCLLKNEAIYPFTLPFHQPIEAARVFLKYLGTSRYEVLDTFRSAHETVRDREKMPGAFSDTCASQEQAAPAIDPRRLPDFRPDKPGALKPGTSDDQLEKLHKEVLDRAAEAEFLGLTQEEYIILTREAFWPKRYFEVTQNTTFTEEQYRKNIGVKDPWLYYGYSSQEELLDADKSLARGLSFVKAKFLPRTGIHYTDVVELLKTHFINPRYPQGKALAFLQTIAFSYRFLQSLVDTSKTDPQSRFAKLIEFLESNQPLVDASHLGPVTSKHPAAPNPELRRWVYCCFESLGQLIVLDSGDQPRLPIEGKLFIDKPGVVTSFAELRRDGTLVNVSNGLLYGTVPVRIADDDDGVRRVYAGPVNWVNPDVAPERIIVRDQNDHVIGRIDSDGLWTFEFPRESMVPAEWIAPRDTCDLDKVRLLHLDGSSVTVDEFDRMQRFIRLWRKLGWTIDEVDKALVGLAEGFAEAAAAGRDVSVPHVGFDVFKDRCRRDPDGVVCCGDFAIQEEPGCDITPAFLHQLVAVKKLLDRTGLPLIKLLSFWSDISTAGEKSLYSRLFLTHNMLGIDDVFLPDANGNYLASPEPLVDHIPVVMAALKLKAEDIAAITECGRISTELSLPNVSAIYRHALLAKALRIKPSELIDLKRLFGEPFTNADTTLALFNVWEKMEEAGFTLRQLAYIIKNSDDPLKPLAPSRKTILQVAKTLYDGLTAIERDNQDVATAEDATTDLVRAKAGQLFEPETVEKIVGLLDGTRTYAARVASGLTIEISSDKPTLARKLKYIDKKDAASLQVTGLLTDTEQADARALCTTNADWAPATDRAHKQAEAFFNDALAGLFRDDKKSDADNQVSVDDAKSRLLAGDVVVPDDQIPEGQDDPNTAPAKRFYFLQHYLPLLRQRLEVRFITDTVSAAAGLSPEVASALLSEVLRGSNSSESAMDVLRGVNTKAATSGWTGYLIPPADGKYAFVASVSDQTSDTPPKALTIEGLDGPVEFGQREEDPTNVWYTDPIVLTAGKLYALKVSDRDAAELQWRTTGSATAQLPTSALLPDFTNAGFEEVLAKLWKAAMVVNGFNLSADEVRYFNAHPSDFARFDFNAVTLASWQRIAGYVALRDTLPKAGTPLLELFAWACNPPGTAALLEQIAAVTQWDKKRIQALIARNHFDLTDRAAFRNEQNLLRMQRAIAVADKVGVDIDRLFDWAVPGSKFGPCHRIAEAIRMAIRARFEEEDWEQAVKPLSDQLREMQKQALVSFLLVQPELVDWPVFDADSLFEYFLIDVQMGVERHTSRMVQATSSVQLFIKRCLMGLEEKYGVKADAIDAKRWEWMQKYRVWEANRKVYLYPENWIQPELRDDKSAFYEELESELLQKDVNTQNIQDALQNYLYKVDEVANLQVVGLFAETPDTSMVSSGRLHVFGRTRNAPYLFYYRYYDISARRWYPWEKIQVDIPSYDVEDVDEKGKKTGKAGANGTYLIPVVWNHRLLIFFPQFMKKTVPASSDKTLGAMANSTTDSLKPGELWEIKMAWSEYRSGKWTQKQVSSDALYSPVNPGSHISAYVFVPTTLTTPPGIAIDVYHEKEKEPAKPEEVAPPAASLQSATLTIKSLGGQIPLSVSDLKVTRIVDGVDKDVIATLSSNPTEKLGLTAGQDHPDTTVLDLQTPFIGDFPTLDECHDFGVSMAVGATSGQLPIAWSFHAEVSLTFEGQDAPVVLIAKRDAEWLPTGPGYTAAHFEADGPTLTSALLHVEVPQYFDGKNGDGKNNDTTFDVIVRDANGVTIARLTNGGEGQEYVPGRQYDESLPVLTPALTKAECQRFTATITQYVPSGFEKHDTWIFNAIVTLTFQDGSTFTASNTNIVLHDNNQSSTTLTSTDTYTPPPPQPAEPPADNAPLADDTQTKRFNFTGNQLSVADIPGGDSIQDMSFADSHFLRFHYLELTNRIHSLQARDGSEPPLRDSEPYFDTGDNSRPTLAVTADDTPQPFFYPLSHDALGQLNTGGLNTLMSYYQTLPSFDASKPVDSNRDEAFGAMRSPSGRAIYNELTRPYSLYNWEIGFHAPMHLMDRLLKSQQFDQALAMCHFVFNPLAPPAADGTSEDITKRCWLFLPFKEIDAKRVLQDLFNRLEPGRPDYDITEWRDRPFQPHVVARNRPSAYMKYVVMKYIETLIAYGDYYFRQNTMESIPMAIQCYVMASHLYGRRGEKIPCRGKSQKQTYKSLLERWDAFGNAMVELELAFPFSNQGGIAVDTDSGDAPAPNIFGFANTLYFGIPDNPNLTALRDTIDDRLLKIRSCENIEGIFQQLPLFEPPIDPALLVQAAAQGLSLSSVLSDMNSPMPNYRFYYLLQKALELCGEVKSLGAAFLSAKEKGDAEAIANMRARHERGIQDLMMEVRKQQVEEAQKSLEALRQSRKAPASRMQYYLRLIGPAGEATSNIPKEDADFSEIQNQIEEPVDESGLKLIQYEKEEMDKASAAADWQLGIGIVETLVSILHAGPTINTHAQPMGVGATVSWGFPNAANATQSVARGMQVVAGHLSFQSSNAGRKGGFLRQLQDRVQQANAAGYEIKNIDKQILTQQIRIAIANQEITNQQRQMDNAQETEDFLRNKYTNDELYSWMEGSIRTLYYQAYTLAYDLAKKAEKAYRFERGLTASNFIQFGYWDAGRDGLLAGERLHLALKQLEAAYQEKRGYDFEVTKHVSLRQTNPLALLQLRQDAMCEFALPEVLFDMDHPGHYMRRIKSVALTVPCVVGPYTNLNCTLRLLEHKFRTSPIATASDYMERMDGTEDRFSTINVPITSIAVGSGQNDSGVFELNFRDERYIPFEGAGAISKWRLELPRHFRQFDYDTISDVVLHLRYTASEGGNQLANAAATSVQAYIESVEELSQQEGLFAAFDLKHDFPNEWYQAINVPSGKTRTFNLNTICDRLPIFSRDSDIEATDVYLIGAPAANTSTFKFNDDSFGAGPRSDTLALHNSYTLNDGATLTTEDTLTNTDKIWLVFRYTLQKKKSN